jgi:hypothetical protein
MTIFRRICDAFHIKPYKEQEDMKTYVITLSQTFPATHSRKGQPTFFKQQLLNALNIGKKGSGQYAVPHSGSADDRLGRKLHTIRANYPLWKERFDQIARGEACLSIRQWTGKPYASKQVEIARLTIEDGIGLQRIKYGETQTRLRTYRNWFVTQANGLLRVLSEREVANHDGLSEQDWVEWFNNPAYDKREYFAIIHFTKFRY